MILTPGHRSHSVWVLFQAGEEGGEEKLALEEDENTKINMEHYYPEEYDQYAEGMRSSLGLFF